MRLTETLRHQTHKSAIVPLQDFKNTINMYSVISKIVHRTLKQMNTNFKGKVNINSVTSKYRKNR